MNDFHPNRSIKFTNAFGEEGLSLRSHIFKYNMEMIDCSDYFSSFEISYIWKWCSENYYRSLIKVKFSTDQVRRALGSGGCSFVVCHHAQKPENGPNSDLFNLTPKYFLPLLHFKDLVPPSTDPVPPSTNQYLSCILFALCMKILASMPVFLVSQWIRNQFWFLLEVSVLALLNP